MFKVKDMDQKEHCLSAILEREKFFGSEILHRCCISYHCSSVPLPFFITDHSSLIRHTMYDIIAGLRCYLRL